MTDNTFKLAEIRARLESAQADYKSLSSNASLGRWAGAASYFMTRDSSTYGRALGTLGGIGGYLYARDQSSRANAADRTVEAELQLALALTTEACNRAYKVTSEIQECVWFHNIALERALHCLSKHPKILLTRNSIDVVTNPHRTTQMRRFLEYNRAICQVVSTLPKADDVFNSMTRFHDNLDRAKLSQEITLSWLVMFVSFILTFFWGVGGLIVAIGWYVGHRYHGITPMTKRIRVELAHFVVKLNACGPIRFT